MAFTGFPEQGLAFLRELARNNDRDWFEAHRAAWDEGIVPAMMAWCGELTDRLRDVMPVLVFQPRIGGSLYRHVRPEVLPLLALRRRQLRQLCRVTHTGQGGVRLPAGRGPARPLAAVLELDRKLQVSSQPAQSLQAQTRSL